MFKFIHVRKFLYAVFSMAFVHNAYSAPGDTLNSMRFQSETVTNECIGGSRSDSKVGLWSCAKDTERYNWELVETGDPEVFYIRNIGKRNRCLMSKSDNYYLRYYKGSNGECRWTSYAQWRIQKTDGTYYSKYGLDNDIFGRNIRLVNVHNGKCITEIDAKARLKPCDGSRNQLFEVNAPEDIHCQEVIVDTYTTWFGEAACNANGVLLETYVNESFSAVVRLEEEVYDPDFGYDTVQCYAYLPYQVDNPIFGTVCD